MKVLLFGRCFDGTIMFTLLLWVIVSFYFQVHPDPTRTFNTAKCFVAQCCIKDICTLSCRNCFTKNYQLLFDYENASWPFSSHFNDMCLFQNERDSFLHTARIGMSYISNPSSVQDVCPMNLD